MLKIHDCTIHEGGYRNNWNFGREKDSRTAFINELALVGSDVVDVGVLGKRKKNSGGNYFTDFLKVPEFEKVTDVTYCLTILDVAEFSAQPIRKISSVDNIRLVITNKTAVCEIQSFCEKLRNYGYQINIYVECRWEEDIHRMAEYLSELGNCKPDAIVLDDVAGIYRKVQILDVLLSADQWLDSGITLGYRARNFRGQAQELVEYLASHMKKHTFAIEVSVFGISRNVSLLELESVMMYLHAQTGRKCGITRLDAVADVIYQSIGNVTSLDIDHLSADMVAYAVHNGVRNIAGWKKKQISQMVYEHRIDDACQAIAQETCLTIEEMDVMFHRMAVLRQAGFHARQCYEFIEEYRKYNYGKKIAVVIWTDPDDAEQLEVYLDAQAAHMAQSGIDIYFCSITIGGCVSEIVKKYVETGVTGIYCLNNHNGMMDTVRDLLAGYHYLWMNQPEYVIDFEYFNRQMISLLDQDYDFIFAENDWEHTGKEGIFQENLTLDIFQNKFMQIYSIGTVIFSSSFLKKVIKEGQDAEGIKNEKDFAFSIFSYLAEHETNGISYYGNVYTDQNRNRIFNAQSYLTKWTTELEQLMDVLPQVYHPGKGRMGDFESCIFYPFSKQRLFYLKLQQKDVRQRLWNYVGRSSRLMLLCPSWLCRLVLEYRDRFVWRAFRKLWGKAAGFRNRLREFAAYTGVDFDKFSDCFIPQEQAGSKLIYGDPDYIKNPWLTIVIPTYQRADLLEDALSSVLRQEDIDHPWDIIVVDNEEVPGGEHNETEELIRKIGHPRILYYRNEKNLGVSGNYNRGIELARGEWVSLLHSDDILVKGYLKRMGKQIDIYAKKAGKKIGYISASYQSFFSENLASDIKWRVALKCWEEALYKKQQEREAVLIRVRRAEFMLTGAAGVSLPSNGTVMNREAVLAYGGFNDDLGICADIVLPLRLMKKYAVYRTDDIMGFYRVGRRNESSADNNTYKIEKNYHEIRECYYRKTLGGRVMGFLFRQQHFLTVDRILGSPYWMDASLQSIYQFEVQKFRDWLMLGKYGVVHLFYRVQRRWSITKGRIMTRIFWNE